MSKHSMKKNHTRAVPMLCTATLLAVPAIAQQPSPAVQPETLTITATRQAYQGDFKRLETPQAEQTIDAETLRASGAVDLNQALALSATVARQNNFGGLWNAFAIRGFVGDENLPSNYLVNGFNAGRGFGGPRDLSGIESVEVLKGPRAALFGRGEPGGTVNLVTKRPTFKTAGEFRLSAGSFDTYRADADWTAPLSDNVAVRFVGYTEDAGSFRNTVETSKHGASPSIAWRISPQSNLVYELEYSQQKIPFDRGVLALNGQLGRIPESRFLGEPGDGPLKADVQGHQLEFQRDFNKDWSALLGITKRKTSLEGFSTEAELATNRQRLLVDGQTLTRQRRFRDYDADYQVVRAEINGRFKWGGLQHRVIFGLDSDRFENDQVFLRARAPALASNPTLAQQQAINIFNPVYGSYTLPTPTPLTNRVETQQSSGFFLQDQINLSDRVQLRVGARYDDYKQTLNNRANGQVLTQKETRVSPQLGLVFRADPSLSLYATYGENFRPLSGVDARGNGFTPNQSTALEAGAKFSVGGIDGTVALFQVRQKNILVADDPSALTLAAIGQAKSRGIEIDLQGEIANGYSIWASYAYVDAKTTNTFNDANFGVPVPAGTPLLNVPKQSLSLQLVKSMTLAGRGLQLGGGVVHVGKRSGEFTTNFKLPAYTLARAFAAYEVTKTTTLRLDVDNIFDETYYTNSFSTLWVQPGTPRSVRLSATFKF
ncbi:MAG: TonB-dependent siderophore receptor [Rhodocyclaceae bacterium]|nr:TonB-dependent siderophore receptor [Rhodocyclaceae bacterium]MCA3083599.1 TonB-dependent siderophore receptor [Rhodocyclaceae bacterium]MCA3086357.1 TonB-dependent siderophore receptor [Rhodocyclaceae bacterium]